MLYRISDDLGVDEFSLFWRELSALPQARTTEDVMRSLLQAGFSASGPDYGPAFKAGDVWSPPEEPGGPVLVPIPPAARAFVAALALLGLSRPRAAA